MTTSEPQPPGGRLWPTPNAAVPMTTSENTLRRGDPNGPLRKRPGSPAKEVANLRPVLPERDDPQLTLFAGDSLASPSPSPGRASRRRIAGGSGPQPVTSFATFDPDGCCWRTFQGCLDGEWETYSATWPRSGMTRNGTAYRLSSSVPPIYATASGSWPTPRTAMASMYPEYGEHWNDNRGGESLATAVWRQSFPTPNATDWKGPGNQRSPGKDRPSCDDDLPSRVGGQLNPEFVEWLMGYPRGWTETED